MEKKTLLIVIGGIVAFALAFIILAIVVSEVKSQKKDFYFPQHLNSSQCPPKFSPLPLLLISLDGFKPEYLGRGVTPVLNMMIEKGASAPFMAASFPSITFPNHYTVVTGLYVESHGIIDNSFYDSEFNLTFSYSKGPSNQGRWWGGEPIWNTVQKQGLKSAAYFWPGSEADIGGMRPNKYFAYDDYVPFSTRIDKVIEWLNEPTGEMPSLITVYVPEPDKTGHRYGPDSDEVTKKLAEVDDMIKLLVSGLQQHNILQCVNIVIVSDHGMTASSKEKVIRLEEYLEPFVDKINFKKGIPSMLTLKENYKEMAPSLEKSLSCKRKGMEVFKRTELPLRFHFTNHRRIHDYIIKTEEGFLTNLNSNFSLKGLHGYDNRFKSMNALFVAYGPSFKSGAKIEPFQNIEIYNLLCTLLGVTPAPNNGTQGLLYSLLEDPPAYKDIQEEIPKVTPFPQDTVSYIKLISSGNNGTAAEEILSWSRYMNVTQEEITATFLRHLPWGTPQHLENDFLDVNILVHADHVTGYSSKLKLPLWTSYSIHDEASRGSQIKCWMPDIRLQMDVSPCPSVENIFQVEPGYEAIPLFMPEFVTESSHKVLPSLISNALPVTPQLKLKWESLLLDTLHRRLKYSESPMNILLGPAFDEDSNGLNDNTVSNGKRLFAVPTHMFAIVTRCKSAAKELKECPDTDLDALGFVFPQNMTIDNCLSTEELALEYSAKIRDIELISGLQFYPKLPTKERLNLLLRVHQELWPLSH